MKRYLSDPIYPKLRSLTIKAFKTNSIINNVFKQVVPALVASVLLTSCATPTQQPFVIDSESYLSQGRSERIKFIILHYTAESEAESLRILTTGNVSAHYLIPARDDNVIYNLVPENERAWHAGDGGFGERRILNDTSIGIEIVNVGIAPQYRGALKAPRVNAQGESKLLEYHPYHHYVGFSELQIQKVAQLIKDISTRYDIDPTHIIGHSDMAPSRKIDPGAKFPWERLYKEYGIGAWYDDADKQEFMHDGSYESATVAEIKQLFKDYGYIINNTDEWDKPSRNVIYAFQLHFRPLQPTGRMDLETYAILKALNKKYATGR